MNNRYITNNNNSNTNYLFSFSLLLFLLLQITSVNCEFKFNFGNFGNSKYSKYFQRNNNDKFGNVNPYTELGLEEGASVHEIKRAYRDLALKW